MFSSKPIDRTSYLGGKDALLLLLGSKCLWKQYISARDLVLGASAKIISNLCAPNECLFVFRDNNLPQSRVHLTQERPSLNLR